ncbi:MAG: hypothetical protein CVV41_18030 [Candidatus Riflebacteria bacterium HGW-Riflebacteria-1]|jgi:hypothetical protein|nr:MAG: hypothetical protein CVV41_18030 [Candidatus Riflebacteria bacterium HGW-Riflebacteria-1]
MKKLVMLLLFTLMLVSAVNAEVLKEIQTQAQIVSLVKKHSPETLQFVKDRPIVGYVLTVSSFGRLPGVIQKYLGGIDNTKYSDEYIKANRASIVALQMNGDKPDFYIIDLNVFDQKYRSVPIAEVASKNAKLWKALSSHPEVSTLLSDKKLHLTGALKVEPTGMIRMSALGYAVKTEVTIQSPWGGQTKPAGQDAFLVFDDTQNQYYMVNIDDKGLPIGYLPVR